MAAHPCFVRVCKFADGETHLIKSVQKIIKR